MDASVARAIGQWLDRVRVPAVAGLLALILWVAMAAALAKPLWHDEIYSVLVARLPSVGAIWAAHQDGVDLQPPLNTLATRIALRAFGQGPVAARLPPLAGFSLMILVVAVMLRRRAGALLALGGALVPVQTAAFRYGYEARGYGVMLGLFALALFAWAEAAQGRRRRLWIPVCAVSLAAGVWTHYYAGFAFVAIGAGELVRWMRGPRIDRAMFGGLAAGGILTLPLLPLVATAMEQTSGFWTKAAEEDITTVYRFLLGRLWSQLWGYGGAIVAVALIFTAVSARFWGGRRADEGVPAPGPVGPTVPLHETVALVLTFLAPLVMLLAARVTAGAFTARYGLVAIVAVAVGLPLLIRQLAPRGSLAEIALVVVLAIPLVNGAIAAGTRPWTAADPLAARPLLSDALKRPGPVVASGSLTYLQLWFYAPPLERGRLTYLADPGEARRITGSDTFDRGYLALARWTAVSVVPYDEFVQRHREFRLYASGSGWLLTALEEAGATLELRGAEPGGREFRVVR